jgi:hypothetical protein
LIIRNEGKKVSEIFLHVRQRYQFSTVLIPNFSPKINKNLKNGFIIYHCLAKFKPVLRQQNVSIDNYL